MPPDPSPSIATSTFASNPTRPGDALHLSADINRLQVTLSTSWKTLRRAAVLLMCCTTLVVSLGVGMSWFPFPG